MKKKKSDYLRSKHGQARKYFFWFDKPMRVVSVSKRRNEVVAWDIEEEKRVVLKHTDWIQHKKAAFGTHEAARILNRHFTKLYKWIREGKIPSPYKIPGDPSIKNIRNGQKFLWVEDDFRNAVEYMESYGRLLDVTPSWSEVSANINEDEVIRFVLNDDGEFVPLWRAD